MEESSKENQVESPEPPPTPSLKVRLKYILGQTWKFFFALLVPILYMPIFLWKPKPEYEKCPHAAYLTFLMATYWVSGTLNNFFALLVYTHSYTNAIRFLRCTEE